MPVALSAGSSSGLPISPRSARVVNCGVDRAAEYVASHSAPPASTAAVIASIVAVPVSHHRRHYHRLRCQQYRAHQLLLHHQCHRCTASTVACSSVLSHCAIGSAGSHVIDDTIRSAIASAACTSTAPPATSSTGPTLVPLATPPTRPSFMPSAAHSAALSAATSSTAPSVVSSAASSAAPSAAPFAASAAASLSAAPSLCYPRHCLLHQPHAVSGTTLSVFGLAIG